MRILKALTLLIFLLSANAAHALPSRSGTAATPVPAVQLGIEAYRLWDGRAPVAAKVPVAMHIFANGQHGTGFGGADPALSQWPELLQEWLRAQGLLNWLPRS